MTNGRALPPQLRSGGSVATGTRAHHSVSSRVVSPPLRARGFAGSPATSFRPPCQSSKTQVERARGVLALAVRNGVELVGERIGADVTHEDLERVLERGDSARVERDEGGDGVGAFVHGCMVPSARNARTEGRSRQLNRTQINVNQNARNAGGRAWR